MSRATFFDHVIVDTHRYLASTRATRLSDSLVAVQVSTAGDVWAGELQDVFAINQPVIGKHYFGRMRWFKPVIFDISNTVWAQL